MTTNFSANDQLAMFPTRMSPTDSEVRDILDRARKMRSDAMAKMFNSFFAGLKQRLQIARNMRALSELSDAVLADIGIDRSQIPAISQALAEGKVARGNVKTVVAPVAVVAPSKVEENQQELPLAA